LLLELLLLLLHLLLLELVLLVVVTVKVHSLDELLFIRHSPRDHVAREVGLRVLYLDVGLFVREVA